ncbi:MAG: thiamine pyrophosphate-dependent enzyme, partial [Proteobacteria bacterium]|nr:thiamine pyrophosphate-dependent enzyme [Pseudomonadota bacterium]
VQALWTMAREKLDVVTVIFSNRKYAILQVEFMRVGAHNPGPKAMSMLDLSNPDIDWVAMAAAMGVEAERVDDASAFHDAFARAVAAKGPRLIEAVI